MNLTYVSVTRAKELAHTPPSLVPVLNSRTRLAVVDPGLHGATRSNTCTLCHQIVPVHGVNFAHNRVKDGYYQLCTRCVWTRAGPSSPYVARLTLAERMREHGAATSPTPAQVPEVPEVPGGDVPAVHIEDEEPVDMGEHLLGYVYGLLSHLA